MTTQQLVGPVRGIKRKNMAYQSRRFESANHLPSEFSPPRLCPSARERRIDRADLTALDLNSAPVKFAAKVNDGLILPIPGPDEYSRPVTCTFPR